MENINEILTLDSNAHLKQVKKGDILEASGGSSSKAYYVKSGLLRSYTIDSKGKEHIFMFASEGWVISDIESQEFNQPTELFIDCIEDSEILIVERECFRIATLTEKQLRKDNHLLARRIAVLQRRVIMLMSSFTKDRYNSFLSTYPKLPNRVPQRMIASYLGITPQALSTIRGDIARN